MQNDFQHFSINSTLVHFSIIEFLHCSILTFLEDDEFEKSWKMGTMKTG